MTGVSLRPAERPANTRISCGPSPDCKARPQRCKVLRSTSKTSVKLWTLSPALYKRPASEREAVVALVAVHPAGIAVLARGSDHDRVARHRHGPTEVVNRPSVRGLEIGLLTPVCPIAHEDIGRAGVHGAVVALIAIHP